MNVRDRFTQFCANISVTSRHREDAETKHGEVRATLNLAYYSMYSRIANSMLVGSWGKSTRIRPLRDIDVMFVLPPAVYLRFNGRPGNKQSQLLQEVKDVLVASHSTTRMRADGQVVTVGFFDSYAVQVVPAFRQPGGQYWICNTNNGGSYKTADPIAEASHVKKSNASTKGNTRELIRMMKTWQANCSVQLKSFWIELLAVNFLHSWPHREQSKFSYDLMVRDFFEYLKGMANRVLYVPGTSESILLGDAWLSRAESAYLLAAKACLHEAAGDGLNAGLEWQKIFGTDIPTG